MSDYASVAAHASMTFDKVRNAAYVEALEKIVTPESQVLDLGAGTGILGLEAARLGAGRVYLLDSSPVVRIAQQIARDNGLADKVRVLHTPIEQAEIDGPVDIILSVFTGNFLLEEDLLPLLFLARDRHLAPGGQLLPNKARMEIAPVSMADYYQQHIDVWGTSVSGLDFSAGRRFAVNAPLFDSAKNFQPTLLADPKIVQELDLATATRADCSADIQLTIERDGLCHGFLGWFSMQLGSQWLSTSPLAPAMHWSQVFFPLEIPQMLREGQRVQIGLSRPEFGDWSWSWESDEREERHSHFLNTPAVPSEFRKSTANHRPKLNRRGAALQAALAAMAGDKSVTDIESLLATEYLDCFTGATDIARMVRNLSRKYSE